MSGARTTPAPRPHRPAGAGPHDGAPGAEALAPVMPGTEALGTTVGRFDRLVDEALEHVRGHRLPDALFTTASRLGDFSVVWHIANVARGLFGGRRRAAQIPILALALGAESLIVNQGLKRLFRRPRPTLEGDPRFSVRRPLTSAFPSGHASSAAFTATLLTGWDGRGAAPLWWSVGSVVAASRVYVRIHHASDVVAGMAAGVALGLAARAVLRAIGRA